MKIITVTLATVLTALIFTSCGKEPKMVVRHDGTISGNNNNNGGYTWTACSPKPLAFDESEFVEGGGVNAVYQYYFHVSLDNSQANANGITSADVFFPHVGPGGVTIFGNVSNDATYELLKIENGFLYFRIKTANVVAGGCPLKFNVALDGATAGTYVWFSANGSMTQNVGIDDGVHNYYFITFNNGSVTKAF